MAAWCVRARACVYVCARGGNTQYCAKSYMKIMMNMIIK